MRARRDGEARRPRVQVAPAPLPGEVLETPHGPVHRVLEVGPAPALHGGQPLASARGVPLERLGWLAGRGAPLDVARADRMLFLDTETTGLSGGAGTLPFLVGLGWFDEGGAWHLEQLFLRNPAHEAALLRHLGERLRRAELLVTFNGQRFDWPLLRMRFVLRRVPLPEPPGHLDLLGPARRLLGRALSSVRLQALEAALLGFERENDVPGEQIPSLYRAWLAGRPVPRLAQVFEHNRLDVRAMAALLGTLDEVQCGRWREPSGWALLAAAREAARRGQLEEAVEMARRAAEQGREPAARFEGWRQAGRWLRRTGRYEDARGAWERALVEAPDPPSRALAHLLLSRLLEHRLRSPAQAWPHALAAEGAEDSWCRTRRLQRLTCKLRRAGVLVEVVTSGP